MSATPTRSKIPLLDLRAQYQTIKPEIDAAIQQVLDRGQFILGPEVEALERELAAYCGTQHAVGVGSGTDALELALRACGIGPGDEVVTTAYSFFATAEAIVAVGAVPVFVDIESRTYNIDPAQAAAAITAKTKALLPVHLYGHPAAIEPLVALARQHGLKVVEDCAQAIGATWHNQRVGSFGHAAALSFFPSKNLGGYGDGGMVLTNDAKLAEQVRLLRVHGSKEKYRHLMPGRNSRLDELQAAILRVKLRYLERWTEERRQHAARYTELFQRRLGSTVKTPVELSGMRHVYHLYCICTALRPHVIEALQREGIGHQVAYPSPLPHQPALNGTRRGAFPQAEETSRTILALPLYPELFAAQQDEVVNVIEMALKQS